MTTNVGMLQGGEIFFQFLELKFKGIRGIVRVRITQSVSFQAQFESPFSLPPTSYPNPFLWSKLMKSRMVQVVKSCTGGLGPFRCPWVKLVQLPCSRRLTAHRVVLTAYFYFAPYILFILRSFRSSRSLILIGQFTGRYNWRHTPFRLKKRANNKNSIRLL